MGKRRHARIRAKSNAKTSRRTLHVSMREGWDKRLTLKQNYVAMGLVPSLNGHAGGTVSLNTDGFCCSNDDQVPVASLYDSPAVINLCDMKQQRMEREEEEGSIEPIIATPLTGLGIGCKIGRKFNLSPAIMPESEIVLAMIKEANAAVKIVRKTSEQERMFLTDLLTKHGDDYQAMARNSRLNPYLISAGQLKIKFARFLIEMEKELQL